MSEDWKQPTYGWVNLGWMIGLFIVNYFYARHERKTDEKDIDRLRDD